VKEHAGPTHGANGTGEAAPVVARTVPLWVDALGWAGSLTVLGAHAAVSLGRLDDGGALYAGANLAGSLALVVMCARRAVWPAVCLNTVWGLVALVKLVALALGGDAPPP
jgi:hypothetical protein